MTTSICDKCKHLFDDDQEDDKVCPECGSNNYDYPDDDSSYCLNKKCNYYLEAQQTNSPHCPHCSAKKNKMRLYTGDELGSLITASEKSLTKGDKQLKALIQKAESFVSGSGTHHKSKGGSHTSAATEKHSAAMKGKKLVRDKYIEQLQQAMEKASNKKLISEAKNVVKSVQNK